MQMDIMTCEHLHTIGDQSKWHKGEPTALAKLIWRLIQAPLIMCNKEHKPTNAKNEKSESHWRYSVRPSSLSQLLEN